MDFLGTKKIINGLNVREWRLLITFGRFSLTHGIPLWIRMSLAPETDR
jgi:hypothetical protein